MLLLGRPDADAGYPLSVAEVHGYLSDLGQMSLGYLLLVHVKVRDLTGKSGTRMGCESGYVLVFVPNYLI